jgi:membrane associated rhomboid family serine protease
MFLFPLGLGLPLPKFPWLTILLMLSQLVFYFTDKNFSLNHEELAKLFQKSEKQEKLIDLIIAEDCKRIMKLENFCGPIETFFKGIDRQKTEDLLEKWNQLSKEQRKFIIETRQTIYLEEKKLELTTEARKVYVGSLEVQETAQSDYIEDHHLLAQDHVTFSRLIHAQFSHMDISHLLLNLAFLAVFGAYVELAVGGLFYLLTYFAAGFAGLALYAQYFAGANAPVLGSSANVAGIIGAFFYLFLKHRMTFFVLILFYFRVAKIKVLWAMPIIFFAREFLGTLEKDSGVAHQAHLVGYFIGILCAICIRQLKKLEGRSLYAFEAEMIKSWELKQMSQVMNEGSRILKFNPNNTWARQMIIKRLLCLDQQGKLSLVELNHLQSLIGIQIRSYLEHNETSEILSLLDSLPLKINYKSLCLKLTKESIYDLAEIAFEKESFVPALTFLRIYYEHFPESKPPKDADGLTTEVGINLNRINPEVFSGIVTSSQSLYFKNLLSKINVDQQLKEGA